jgi:predicted DNA-binding antitoxin AbrB/MazE fold protein
MDRMIEVVYEGGVLRPLESLDLPDHQRVTITLHMPPVEDPDAELAAWQSVYGGLSTQEIDEVEAIALDRGRFMAPAE